MRFGLVGTGYWARETHAAALAGVSDIDFVGVWGRDPAKAAALADHAGGTPFAETTALFDAVDAVVFSVPPEVQAPLATRAARMGKHLLLEKPIALSARDAAGLAQAVEAAGVASVVFFTSQFTPEGKAWLSSLTPHRWEGATARWLGNAFADGSPPYVRRAGCVTSSTCCCGTRGAPPRRRR